ncbi:MAG TPA: hypothetical protein PLJ60_08660 [Chryseolinea sp.]|nr:hypothetical protein [Chryseolinea sp.]HPM30397.1 hypothetical protein [Chryseolinea sp.]
MVGLYTPVLILQAFCLYHAYKHNSVQQWYWLIIFLPGIGSALYLYHSFYNRSNIETLTDGVKNVVNSNYKIEQLEKAHRLSDNVTTKTNLANAYVTYERYDDAVTLYKECLTGFMEDDPVLLMKLLQAYFLKKDYDAVIDCGRKLESDKSFKKAEERISYAWAYYHKGIMGKAEETFMDMDRSFSNYVHRLEYCKFLLAIKRQDAFRDKLKTLMEEFEVMKGTERKFNINVIRQARELYSKNPTP